MNKCIQAEKPLPILITIPFQLGPEFAMSGRCGLRGKSSTFLHRWPLSNNSHSLWPGSVLADMGRLISLSQ